VVLPMIDALDGRLIELLMAEPRVGVLEASRRLGVARGTVQARLDRIRARHRSGRHRSQRDGVHHAGDQAGGRP
jgi:hypothetical protein